MSKKRHNLESKLMVVRYVLEENHSLWEASDFFRDSISDNKNMS